MLKCGNVGVFARLLGLHVADAVQTDMRTTLTLYMYTLHRRHAPDLINTRTLKHHDKHVSVQHCSRTLKLTSSGVSA
jgi:hypothetical protein